MRQTMFCGRYKKEWPVHIRGEKVLGHFVLRQGYLWPTMMTNASNSVKKMPLVPGLWALIAAFWGAYSHRFAWPFKQWGIDIISPFPLALAQHKFLLMVIKYFMKWVEADAVSINEKSAQKFILIPSFIALEFSESLCLITGLNSAGMPSPTLAQNCALNTGLPLWVIPNPMVRWKQPTRRYYMAFIPASRHWEAAGWMSLTVFRGHIGSHHVTLPERPTSCQWKLFYQWKWLFPPWARKLSTLRSTTKNIMKHWTSTRRRD